MIFCPFEVIEIPSLVVKVCLSPRFSWGALHCFQEWNGIRTYEKNPSMRFSFTKQLTKTINYEKISQKESYEAIWSIPLIQNKINCI